VKKIIAASLLVAAAWFGLSLDQRTPIMFDPATDGPIRYEEHPRYSPTVSSGGVCATTMAVAGGSQATTVLTPCSASGSAWFVTTAGSGGYGR